ncbi:hypothetical protein HMPREF1555_00991 [Porphyromonas gingivalis F0570]|uniref:Uncharacterized protein n=1 Tax=Porphyromonas gingivalis F0570 TaxID=1227271 RepID=A0A0E2LRL2_PORGN|nr:hypothetical protein HMPREF1555_00991 [Porphyromonas gingivalis F0570]
MEFSILIIKVHRDFCFGALFCGKPSPHASMFLCAKSFQRRGGIWNHSK